MTTAIATASDRRAPLSLGVLALILAGALALLQLAGLRQMALFAVGAALGLVLYHAAFGFTSSWRVMITERRGRGLRAQMVMLALAVLLFFPALSQGDLAGQAVSGFVSPLGTSVLVGAFIFGVGMQLGGGCASGTLFTAGGGNARMLVTLVFFCMGSLISTHHVDWWFSLPALEPVSLVEQLGLMPALVLNLAVFALIAGATVVMEKRRHGGLEAKAAGAHQGLARLLKGPWPLIWGAVALALLNYATLALAGRPWGVTSAFALWSAKLAQDAGLDVSGWAFWQYPGNASALSAPVWQDITSVMNIGIMLGALLAAVLAGKFAPNLRIPRRSLLAAVIGGLLLGYGARMAYGCNIGAYFSGIASGSLHGWLWLVAAFAGNMMGVRLRGWFFPGERPKPALNGC
ncbi:YeeE/YedE family protein [Oceanimonas doudoroffii]|uniref:Uncharacterized protein n=1 Tax=Oceanimonas doudoroffii TaxID=84158 RepID=A0A233RIZ7_9GAMM|nr:YeeE/YedE family protein [Oceanimonas doudoroffii]OXY83367.1 hypothetical protein B6S08_07740 [Oceanimonas doudoroffii]